MYKHEIAAVGSSATSYSTFGSQFPARVEYHAPMLAVRIKQRPVLFTAWFMSAALLLASIATFITGFGYFGNTKQVMFISGGLLIQDAPLEGVAMGLKTFNVEMPDRGIGSRVRGFFMLPQHIGSSLWIRGDADGKTVRRAWLWPSIRMSGNTAAIRIRTTARQWLGYS